MIRAAARAARLRIGVGRAASGCASRISMRKSVYFQSSSRRCGSPVGESARTRRRAPPRRHWSPGNVGFAAANASAKASSALVLMDRTSAFMAVTPPRSAYCAYPVASSSSASSLPPLLHDAAGRQHMHDVGNDVVEQALIMGDHDHGALRRAQLVDAVGDHLEGVDVEAGVGLVEHRRAAAPATPSAASRCASSRRPRNRH